MCLERGRGTVETVYRISDDDMQPRLVLLLPHGGRVRVEVDTYPKYCQFSRYSSSTFPHCVTPHRHA